MNANSDINTVKNIGPKLTICQINVEGISCDKSDYMSKQFKVENVDVALIQETHTASLESLQLRGCIAGYELVVAEFSRVHGIATYVKKDTKNVKVLNTETIANTYTSTISIGSTTITNVYKAPTDKWPDHVLKTYSHPAVPFGSQFNAESTQK